MEEKNVQVLGISCDTQHSHRAWSNSLGNIRFPLLADFHPHGEMCKTYGVFNETNGAPRRAIIIINTKGKVIFSQEYTSIPSPDEILAELD